MNLLELNSSSKKELKSILSEICANSNVDVEIAGINSCPVIQFNVDDELIPFAKTLFVQEMAKQGIHMSTVFHPNMSHNQEDITITANAIEKTLKVIEKIYKESGYDYCA